MVLAHLPPDPKQQQPQQKSSTAMHIAVTNSNKALSIVACALDSKIYD
jgi:hypothetical protein